MLNKELWKKRFREILSLDSHPGHISAGFAVGVFISFTPPIPFLHTVLAVAAALLFRLNKITCITGAWVNTPLTVIPVLLLSYKLGNLILGATEEELALDDLSFDWESAMELLDLHGTPILLGSSLLGFVAALISYFLCYYLVVRFRRKDEALAELTREMERVGEDISEQ